MKRLNLTTDTKLSIICGVATLTLLTGVIGLVVSLTPSEQSTSVIPSREGGSQVIPLGEPSHGSARGGGVDATAPDSPPQNGAPQRSGAGTL